MTVARAADAVILLLNSNPPVTRSEAGGFELTGLTIHRHHRLSSDFDLLSICRKIMYILLSEHVLIVVSIVIINRCTAATV